MTARAARVLDVGQCSFDHANISRMLKEEFGATVDRAGSIDQVLHMHSFYDYDLVLVNRVFDADGAEGLALIRRLKAGESTRHTPLMLVSNHADAQEAAQKAGAVPGFGKAQLNDAATVELLAPYLRP